MIWTFLGCSRDVPGTSTHLCWARWTEESYSEHWYEKSKIVEKIKWKSRKMKCLKKKKISFLPFFIFHKRSYFFSFFFSFFFHHCDHALSNSLCLFLYRILILQEEIWSIGVKGYRSFSMHPSRSHAHLKFKFYFLYYFIWFVLGQLNVP